MSIFDSASLSSVVKRTLADADIPAEHRHAFLLSATTQNGGTVKGVFVTKGADDLWELDTYVSIARHASVEAGVQFKASW